MKKALIGIGLLAVAGGVAFYMYNRSKKDEVNDDTASQPTPSDKTIVNQVEQKKTESPSASKVPVTKKQARKQSRTDKKTYKADCGKRPILKKKRAQWQACVDSAKSSSFDGGNEFEVYDLSEFDM